MIRLTAATASLVPLTTLMLSVADTPLFLQVNQANASVLEAYAGKSVYAQHGERVVQG